MRLSSKVATVVAVATLSTGVAGVAAFSGDRSDDVPMCDAAPRKGEAPCSVVIDRLRAVGFDCVLRKEQGDNVLHCRPIGLDLP